MYAYKFADLIMISDFGKGRLIFKRKVLWFVANHGVHVDFVVVADFRARADISPGEDFVVGSDFRPIFNDDMGSDDVVIAQFGKLSDKRCGMNRVRHGAHCSMENRV